MILACGICGGTLENPGVLQGLAFAVCAVLASVLGCLHSRKGEEGTTGEEGDCPRLPLRRSIHIRLKWCLYALLRENPRLCGNCGNVLPALLWILSRCECGEPSIYCPRCNTKNMDCRTLSLGLHILRYNTWRKKRGKGPAS